MALNADSLKIGVTVIIGIVNVIDLLRESRVADLADRIALKDVASDSLPIRREALAPRAAFPRLALVIGARLEVGAAWLGAYLGGSQLVFYQSMRGM
jgi:hypothetical protein